MVISERLLLQIHPNPTLKMKTLLTLLAAISLTSAAATEQYTLVIPESVGMSAAFGVNDSGSFCGVAGNDPFIWKPDGTATALYRPSQTGTQYGVAYSINNTGLIAGNFSTMFANAGKHRSNPGQSYVWALENETEIYIPYQFAAAGSRIYSITDSGIFSGDNDGVAHSRNAYTNIGYTSTLANSSCRMANASGNATGSVKDQVTQLQIPIFIEHQGSGIYTTTLADPAVVTTTDAIGLSINNLNQVVGQSSNGGFYWEPKTGVFVQLGANTIAYDINNNGTIVGEHNGHACMWNKVNGSFVISNLNSCIASPGVTLTAAYDISETGHIVGVADVSGISKAYMLKPPTLIATKAWIEKENGSIKLSWETEPGKSYRVRSSVNLISWSNFGEIRVATGSSDHLLFPPNGKMFFRVFEVAP